MDLSWVPNVEELSDDELDMLAVIIVLLLDCQAVTL
jgi:hypothetical protein